MSNVVLPDWAEALPPNVEAHTSWTITIPRWRPASVNELTRSVRGRIRRKKADRAMVATYAALQDVPIAILPSLRARLGRRRVSLRIALGPRDRRADPDNLFKSLLDALVHAGLLKDDGSDWVELGPIEYHQGDELQTTIILTELGGGSTAMSARATLGARAGD